MRIKFDRKKNALQFGNFGQVQFQRGSLVNHKQNGISDVDLVAGLAMFVEQMEHEHHSIYNELALGNLHSAFEWLKVRRGVSHDKAKKNK